MDRYELIRSLPNIKLKILDYYCGNGDLSYFLSKHNQNWTVIGCDDIFPLSETLGYYSVAYPKQLEPPNVLFKPIEEISKEEFDYVLYSDTKPIVKSGKFIKIQR